MFAVRAMCCTRLIVWLAASVTWRFTRNPGARVGSVTVTGLPGAWAVKVPVFALLNCHANVYGEVPPVTVAVKVVGPPGLMSVVFLNEATQFNV
jgi:hypothetical protein